MRTPTANLPAYVSLHDGFYRYYRRPPKGLNCPPFVRGFRTKNLKDVHVQYGAVHREAEQYFALKLAGRDQPDTDLKMLAAVTVLSNDPASRSLTGHLPSTHDMYAAMVALEPRAASLSPADLKAALRWALSAYLKDEVNRVVEIKDQLRQHEAALIPRVGSPDQAKLVRDEFTLKDAYDQAWKPAKNRGKNTEVEVGRYVDEFIALNGLLPLREYTREHWAKWRASCLEKHGPGATALKRFSMIKTITHEAIRAGLFERKDFAGQDVVMKKLKGANLRNEGWLQDELTEFFGAPVFRGAKDSPHPDADYWVAVIIAHTGARLSEVSGMLTTDVAERHGLRTFFLAKEHGKSEDSRRIIPIPQAIIVLGFLKYVATRPKNGDLFEDVSPKLMSQTYSRIRADVGIDRKGCDIHALRHHMKTLLSDLDCPDRVSDYITGHAPPNVGRRYGKTELQTALRFLNGVDLGVKIPKWKA